MCRRIPRISEDVKAFFLCRANVSVRHKLTEFVSESLLGIDAEKFRRAVKCSAQPYRG
jgi:hypothetical protein